MTTTESSSTKTLAEWARANKFLSQTIAGLVAALFLYFTAETPAETALLVPLFKDVAIPLGVGFVALTWFVIVGTSNAVNLTDGLDGLAIMPTVMVAGALGRVCLRNR